MHAFVTQMSLQIVDEDTCLVRGDMPGGMVFQQISFDADKIAPHGQVTRLELDPHAGSLEHAPPLVDLTEVIAQDGHVGHLAPRVESLRHRPEHPATPAACQRVHVRRMGMLQQGVSAQRIDRPVGHAVAQDDDVFHWLLRLVVSLYISYAHDVGKDSGSRDAGSRSISLYHHRIFPIAFCREQDDVVAAFQSIKRMAHVDLT